MTGVGDGVSYSIPLERMPRLPSDHHLEKKAPRGGGIRIAARSGEHGDFVRNWTGKSKGYARP